MTSYPVGNKISLSQKPCIPDKKNGMLSKNHGRSYRIGHEISREALPGGDNTITSYPACNKTLLSWKPCIPDKKFAMGFYQEVMVTLLESGLKSSCSASWRRTDDDVIFDEQYNLVVLETMQWQLKSCNESQSWSLGHSFRIRHAISCEAPPGGDNTITLYPVCNNTSLSRKPCIADKKLLLNAFMKSWSLSNLSW